MSKSDNTLTAKLDGGEGWRVESETRIVRFWTRDNLDRYQKLASCGVVDGWVIERMDWTSDAPGLVDGTVIFRKVIHLSETT